MIEADWPYYRIITQEPRTYGAVLKRLKEFAETQQLSTTGGSSNLDAKYELALRAMMLDLQELDREKSRVHSTTVGNTRARCIKTLTMLGGYLRLLAGGTEASACIDRILVALLDLEIGITDPLLKAVGTNKGDPAYIWLARMETVLALERFIRSGTSREQAARQVARRYPELARLKRGENRDLASSILSWQVRFMNGDRRNRPTVPNARVRALFKAEHLAMEPKDDLTPEEHRRRGEEMLARAARYATRVVSRKN
jgi:hypothetical protein